MGKFQMPVMIGVIGALVGAIVAEFFPKMLQLGVGDALAAAVTGPFSGPRNHLALTYGLGGLVIGAVIGLVLMVLQGKK